MTDRKPSVMIGFPTNGPVQVQTTASLVMATNMLRSLGHTMMFVVREGPYTHWNREHLANDALEADVDYLMFVDTDVVFSAEAIPTLIGRDYDIVGATYNLKQEDPVATIKLWNDDRSGFRAADSEELPSAPFRVAALPTGFMLINTRVLRGMSFPFFPCEFGLGEDVKFCLDAQQAGFEVWCDPTIRVGHIGNKVY